MRRRTRVARSRRVVILTLLALAAGALLLPRGWTGRLISLVQVLVPFQHAATTVTDSVARAMEGDAPPVPADAYEALQREKLALEHRMASLELRLAELEDENTLLTAARLSEVDGWRIGARGRLIPARVIAKDVLGWRSSALIDAGSLQGVQPGSAVASHLFEVDQGKAAGVRSGMAILRGEVLIGLVEQVGTHTARVKLLSDLSVETKARIGRFTESGFQAVGSSFWMTGRGGGVMQIHGVDRRLVRDGTIKVGDTVLSHHASGLVPAAMTIGRIISIEPDRESPLLSILTVEGAVKEADLERVWVYDPQTPSDNAKTPEG